MKKYTDENKKSYWGYIASLCALLYAAPHLWWGLGIDFAFPGKYIASTNDFWSIAIGFWGMGLVAILAAIFCLAFVRPWGNKIPRLLLVIPGWITAIGLTCWGLGYYYLRFFLGINRVTPTESFIYYDTTAHSVFWGYVWYSLFLIWGLSLLFAVLNFQRKLG
ncbi:DUF3995 domain-containing protein [Metabacillus malikii]|uniref:DUF3995 domain-containing protein n=1 Tax=Metabacillus malikii TaxID=1504265 RepID=A0ABT9ZDW3_9BACI|nr:DUF3995 domain-containing protein [Metabacillus malikii]MDQ0230205.1 hypothetical protein [Metabacillus malikii]